KANSKYNDLIRAFVMCLRHNMLLYVVCPIKPLMGRDGILQQTPLKLHLIKRKNKIKKLNEKIKK
ncbi:hypothetical protein BB411_06900, partial [Helicobacter pylori]